MPDKINVADPFEQAFLRLSSAVDSFVKRPTSVGLTRVHKTASVAWFTVCVNCGVGAERATGELVRLRSDVSRAIEAADKRTHLRQGPQTQSMTMLRRYVNFTEVVEREGFAKAREEFVRAAKHQER